MGNKPIIIKVPGKLMVAGEFAVLEPHQKLAVMAVDRFVYATLQPSNTNQLTLENFDLNNLHWDFNNQEVNVETDDSKVLFVQNAMTVALTYLEEQSIPTHPFHLSIKSELDDGAGKKYGLGSSAAVVTAVISSILHAFYPEKAIPKLIFKLASITHVKTQGNGSGADVAASSYGGFLEYSSFQAEWLAKNYQELGSLRELLQRDWKYLSIKPVSLPQEIYVCIGWTGSPASTGRLVDEVLELKRHNPQRFQQFLDQSEEAVQNILMGMRENSLKKLFLGVKQNRRALREVGDAANVEIETQLLGNLCDIAEQLGGAAKPSGAGGGDCGIAFMPTKAKASELLKSWEAAGITPLDIQPTSYGASLLK
ncbi:phosphomevalonate kinase [Ornithinibacillus halophilus]